MGFRPAIETMLRALPPRTTRQTLLFSATFPKQVGDDRKERGRECARAGLTGWHRARATVSKLSRNQSAFVSAHVTLHPPQVTQIARVAMRDSFEIVDTVGEDAEATVHSASQVCALRWPLIWLTCDAEFHPLFFSCLLFFRFDPPFPRPCWCAV